MTTEMIQPEKPRKWYEIWWDVWIHPGLAPFKAILSEPGNNITRGFIWIGVTSFIVTLVSYLFSALVSNLMADAIGGEMFKNYSGYTISYICGILLSPLFAILGIAVSALVYHWIAKLLGGRGNWNDLLFCLSAVNAPASIIGGVIALISLLFFQSPVLLFLPTMVALALAVYILVLNVNAIKAAEDVGTWPALGAIFIPTLIGVAVVTCCSLVILVPVISTLVSGSR
jgi:MFS family permease